MIQGKNIIIGVTGGIAAYKSVFLVRELQKKGAAVRVTMTEAATRFVGADTFAAITQNDVPIHIFPDTPGTLSENWTPHIYWAEWADLIVIAPCTGNTLANLVHGFSGSMLSAIVLAARCPILICPSMDGGMYNAPATQANIKKALSFGYHLLEPEEGYLASGMEGAGRLPDTNTILDQIAHLLSSSTKGLKKKAPEKVNPPPDTLFLKGKKVVVTSGATREFIDPVRFISNPSTGKMGNAMAKAASFFGAEVILIHAESSNIENLDSSIKKVSYVTTEELFQKVKIFADADIILMTAAVSDFRPAKKYDYKIKKEEADKEIPFEPTPDILKWLGHHRKEGQVLIGFAMETNDLLQNARNKRIKKNIDWIAANDLTDKKSGFAVDTNRLVLIGPASETPFEGTKEEVAREVLFHIFSRNSN